MDGRHYKNPPKIFPNPDPVHFSYCPHCDKWRDEKTCDADPYINAEPATYCKIALKG
jgi:hypothetical protein